MNQQVSNEAHQHGMIESNFNKIIKFQIRLLNKYFVKYNIVELKILLPFNVKHNIKKTKT